MDNQKILICCDKLRHPNTGLYTFCKELINGIEEIKDRYGLKTSYLCAKGERLLNGLETRYIRPWHKIIFNLKNNEKVLHMVWQMENFTPFSKGGGNRILLTIHDLNYIYEKSPKKVARYNREVQRRVDMADHIVTISEYAKQDILKHLDVGDKPIDVIYNGCTLYSGEQIDEPIYRPKREFLFSIGTILRKKNFHVLPALLVDNDMELIIAGNPSSYSDEIIQEAERLGVDDRVKLTGGISEADKDWYYRNCRAFVFPSVAEGFGLPVIEAMAYGKPTFISRHTSLPEIGKEHCFYFDYNFTPEKMRTELAKGLEIFKSRNTDDQINYARSYSWDKAAEQYCKIYNKLLSL